MENKSDILKRVIAKAGGGSALADALGIRPPAVANWTQVPAKRVLKVEELTGISRHELRPDVFGESA